MTRFKREKFLVQLLLDRLGVHGASMFDPNAGVPETGIDVLVRAADDRLISVQVTEADPHRKAGKARAEENRVAGTDTGNTYYGWGQSDPKIIPDSLSRSISRKVAIAEQHSFASVAEAWLLVCAGIPERGAIISTFVATPCLSAADMDRATRSVLQQSKYHRCFLLAIIGAEQAFYRWEKNRGWKKSVQLDNLFESPREAYVNNLYRAAAAGDRQEVDRLCDEEGKAVLREMRDAG